ncbi:alpha/beta-type small acid-soluble spore protein [Inediibacterium massiliense]|uniref:alpha/beta-type small acid-soluble spore protein n=1 Tax=Inediibacterium massiliense TaxID=1658111 RepID=UPI0006B4A380|nr:alpha/beta-type small acid-soluble spore protein [Inediibacterium massiliense]
MSRNGPVDPNATIALNKLKYEIANELGVPHNMSANPNDYTPGQDIYLAGNVGGQMTKKLVEMGEEMLINKHNQ